MIDLIIPYYNNPEGLKRTLESINTDIFYITVIDDHSPQSVNSIIPNQVFRYNTNRGPGCARQWGIDKTSNPYIVFIDTGDIFVSDIAQRQLQYIIESNPNTNVFSFSYYYKGKLTKELDNRMHGKVYKRAFLEKYDITFAAESSYMNEDIGFNRTCRYCTDAAAQPILYNDIPLIEWIEEENSLTQKNNNEALYKKQTYGLAINAIHTIDILKKNNIDYDAEINQIAIALYYWFIRTAAERKEFIEPAWNGVKLFYDKYADEIKPNQLALGNAYLKNCLQYRNKIWFPINILRFADETIHAKIIPDKYLTFNEI